MAMRIINIVPPNGPNLLYPPNSFSLPTNLPKSRPRNHHHHHHHHHHPILYSTHRINDSELASELTMEVKKMNTHLVQREEALQKSREMLFTEMCLFLGIGSEEVKRRWKKMGEEEKWVLLKGFVSEWGITFHPLSTKSVKEMVEDYLHDDDDDELSSPSLFFPGLKRMLMGFQSNK